MSEFINKPNKEELIKNLELVSEMEYYKASGYDVFISNGGVYFENETPEFLGTLPNLAETTQYLFGDTIPEGVEYITMSGITMLTYNGAIIGCGYMEESAALEGYYSLNDFLNNSIVDAASECLGKDGKNLYDDVAFCANAAEQLLRATDSPTDFDNKIELLGTYVNYLGGTPFASVFVTEYTNVMAAATTEKLVELLLTEFAISDTVIVGCSMKRKYNTVIEWADSNQGGTSNISMNDACILDDDDLKKLYLTTRTELRKYLDEATINYLDEVYGHYEDASQARVYVDPLVFDLGHDGFDVNTLVNGAYFDMDGDGIAEKVNWTTQDAFLALDFNEDGTINDAGELFGDRTKLATGENAQNGFAALAQYDTNGDGIIDANDEIFSKLLIWQDENGDGISDTGELKTLTEIGIKEISLNYNDTTESTGTEATIAGTATFVWEDGTQGKFGEIWLSQKSYDTVDMTDIDIPEELLEYPNIRSYGKMHALQVALANDETGYLKSLVDSFAMSTDMLERKHIVESMLHFMCNTADVESTSRGWSINAKNLTVVETMLGEKFYGVDGSSPNAEAAPVLNIVYSQLVDGYYAQMLEQTSLKEFMPLLIYMRDENDKVKVITDVFSNVVAGYLDTVEGKSALQDMALYLKYVCVGDIVGYDDFRVDFATRGGDGIQFIADATGDILFVEGTTTASGTINNELMLGDESDNIMHGCNGDDILVGGAGADILSGGNGVDTYTHNRGEGNDIINNYDTSSGRVKDSLILGAGIQMEDIEVSRDDSNLLLTDKVTGEKITILNAFSEESALYYLENIIFADGSIWGKRELKEKFELILGTEEDDSLIGFGDSYNYNGSEIIYGGAGNDSVSAGAGNDIIYGEEGADSLDGGNDNDVLIGGTGDDYLYGGYGADTYIHNRGDGNDIINNYDWSETRVNDRLVFGEGIRAEDIEIRRNESSLVFFDLVSGETVTIKDTFFSGDEHSYLENVEFADGTVWGKEELKEKLIVRGTMENDTLSGCALTYNYNANEIFYGGAGDDNISAGAGDDVVLGEEGNDYLYGGEGNDFIDGDVGMDIMSGNEGADTYIHERGDGNDIINNYDTSSTRKNDQLVFGEGIRPEDIEVKRSGTSMVLTDTVSGETVVIRYAYYKTSSFYYLERIVFADGTVWGKEELARKTQVIRGTNNNDTLQGCNLAYNYDDSEIFHGAAGNDTINAGSGNDYVYGQLGDDILFGDAGDDYISGGLGKDKLNGGEGADTLSGGSGSDELTGDSGVDTYVYNRGDGNDVINNYDTGSSRVKDKIVFGAGIKPEEIEVKRDGNNLLLKDTIMGDTIIIKNAYGSASGFYYLELVEFADGTVWGKAELANRTSTIQGTLGDDTLAGKTSSYNYSDCETFYGGAGRDNISGGTGDDIIYGEDGYDYLFGGTGNDTLVGGSDMDYLSGGNGKDIYIHNRGDGNDTIFNYDISSTRKKDCLVFGEGINANEIEINRDGTDLVFIDRVSGETITVESAFSSTGGSYYLENVEFADGTIWKKEDLAEKVVIRGTVGNDSLSGNSEAYNYDGTETFYGEEGNDTIAGGIGNDILVGGLGKDYMVGGIGADTYIYNRGDGNDIIDNKDTSENRINDRLLFGEGVKAEEIEIRRNENNLLVTDAVSGETITIVDAYSDETGACFLENIDFAEGTHWGKEDIAQKASTIHGTEENDNLFGFATAYNYSDAETIYGGAGDDKIFADSGDDVIYGEAGNDTIYAESGNDVLVGGTGDDYLRGFGGADTYIIGVEDGNDIINNFDSGAERAIDKILYGEGIRVEDLEVSRTDNNLVISNTIYGQQTTVENAFVSDGYQINNVEFSDGTTATINYDELKIETQTVVEEGVAILDEVYGEETVQSAENGTCTSDTNMELPEIAAIESDVVTEEESTECVLFMVDSLTETTETVGVSESSSVVAVTETPDTTQIWTEE